MDLPNMAGLWYILIVSGMGPLYWNDTLMFLKNLNVFKTLVCLSGVILSWAITPRSFSLFHDSITNQGPDSSNHLPHSRLVSLMNPAPGVTPSADKVPPKVWDWGGHTILCPSKKLKVSWFNITLLWREHGKNSLPPIVGLTVLLKRRAQVSKFFRGSTPDPQLNRFASLATHPTVPQLFLTSYAPLANTLRLCPAVSLVILSHSHSMWCDPINVQKHFQKIFLNSRVTYQWWVLEARWGHMELWWQPRLLFVWDSAWHPKSLPIAWKVQYMHNYTKVKHINKLLWRTRTLDEGMSDATLRR